MTNGRIRLYSENNSKSNNTNNYGHNLNKPTQIKNSRISKKIVYLHHQDVTDLFNLFIIIIHQQPMYQHQQLQ